MRCRFVDPRHHIQIRLPNPAHRQVCRQLCTVSISELKVAEQAAAERALQLHDAANRLQCAERSRAAQKVDNELILFRV